MEHKEIPRSDFSGETTKSTMKAELATLDIVGAEAEWLHDLLMDLLVVEKLMPTISMNCDTDCDYKGQQFHK
jgi:hypothetical protein